jgi:hypothetical protein
MEEEDGGRCPLKGEAYGLMNGNPAFFETMACDHQ